VPVLPLLLFLHMRWSAASLTSLSSCYSDDRWWKFDDHRQAQVDIKEVVSHPDAYILWYIRSQPRRVVVDAPEGCEVWPPGSAPPSESGVAAEEPQTHSGVSVTEAAQWLIAAGSAAPVSG